MQPRGARFIHTSYSDGRKICEDCKKSAIMNRRDCQPLIDEMRKFYEDLDMKVWQEDIPIYMLDQHEMNVSTANIFISSYLKEIFGRFPAPAYLLN